MSKEKRYFWYQVQESLFETAIFRKLERAKNASDAVYLYMRLLSRACKFDGELFDDTGEAMDAEACGLLTTLDEDEAAAAFNTIVKAGGIQDRGGIYYMPQLERLIGSKTDAADRMAKSRAKAKEREAAGRSGSGAKEEATPATDQETKAATGEELGEADADQDQEEDDQQTDGHITETPAADQAAEQPAKILDLKGKPKKVTVEEQSKGGDPIARIVAKLNEVTGKSFKATTKATRGHISARLAEGYTEEDFFKVIENRAAKWLNDPKMSEYLRPETLFASKFEGYLQNANEAGAGMWKPRPGETLDLTEFDKFMAGGADA